MKRMQLQLALCAAIVPVLAFALATARQELTEAMRKKPNSIRGAELFRNCAVCHGATGGGAADGSVPRVAGQHYEYLMRQIYDGADGRRPNFSPFHIRVLSGLDRPDITGLADFLSRQDAKKGPGSPL
jgi:cytochrome c553